MSLIKEIDDAINMCEAEKRNGSVGYLTTIIKILNDMKNVINSGNLDLKQQELNAAGFTKIVLDNYSFAMSELGSSLLLISNKYAKYKD